MTPQERQLIDDLFDRLAKLESAKRDPEAMSAIMQGLRNAPNAVYALVQTTLAQDEALKRADMRIQELKRCGSASSIRRLPRSDARCDLRAEPAAWFGAQRSRARDGGQPAGLEHRAGTAAEPGARQHNQPAYAQPQPYGGAQQQPSAFGGGGSFLGTAAAAAVGVVGGSMLAGSLRSMMGGGGNQQSFGDTAGHGRRN